MQFCKIYSYAIEYGPYFQSTADIFYGLGH
jgi:hypothetical protein